MTTEPDIDTALVECPNGCAQNLFPTTREFVWVDGSVGRRNYCRECGTELVEVDGSRALVCTSRSNST